MKPKIIYTWNNNEDKYNKEDTTERKLDERSGIDTKIVR
jgi:hypothetical protein